jgi:nitrous oxide reductase accessory protein NosL
MGIMLCLLFTNVPAFALEKPEAPASCQVCGMSRKSLARSRILIVYVDGSTVGTCSLHCASLALHEKHDKKVTAIQVADFNSGKLIDARTAVWVIGSKQKGVMSSVAQLAFGNAQAAQAFVRRHGGTTATFDQALKLADMESTSHKHDRHGTVQ